MSGVPIIRQTAVFFATKLNNHGGGGGGGRRIDITEIGTIDAGIGRGKVGILVGVSDKKPFLIAGDLTEVDMFMPRFTEKMDTTFPFLDKSSSVIAVEAFISRLVRIIQRELPSVSSQATGTL